MSQARRKRPRWQRRRSCRGTAAVARMANSWRQLGACQSGTSCMAMAHTANTRTQARTKASLPHRASATAERTTVAAAAAAAATGAGAIAAAAVAAASEKNRDHAPIPCMTSPSVRRSVPPQARRPGPGRAWTCARASVKESLARSKRDHADGHETTHETEM